jgi:hypothetical protein
MAVGDGGSGSGAGTRVAALRQAIAGGAARHHTRQVRRAGQVATSCGEVDSCAIASSSAWRRQAGSQRVGEPPSSYADPTTSGAGAEQIAQEERGARRRGPAPRPDPGSHTAAQRATRRGS